MEDISDFYFGILMTSDHDFKIQDGSPNLYSLSSEHDGFVRLPSSALPGFLTDSTAASLFTHLLFQEAELWNSNSRHSVRQIGLYTFISLNYYPTIRNAFREFNKFMWIFPSCYSLVVLKHPPNIPTNFIIFSLNVSIFKLIYLIQSVNQSRWH